VKTSTPAIPIEQITAVILAGGRGSRMGGVDKGLVSLQGRTMIEHVVERLRPQVGELLVNANRNIGRYEALGYRVVPDRRDGFLGPLAGMASGLAVAATPYVITAPCDSPVIGPDLVDRLSRALLENEADIAVAHDGERTHPVFLLLRRDLLDDLDAFLGAGGRKIDQWFARHRVAMADFSDCPDAFVNINDAGEHQSIENRIRETA